MSVITLANLDLSRDEVDALIHDAGYFDKDGCGEDAVEYAEQLRLAAALRDKQQRELRKEIARARRARFF